MTLLLTITSATAKAQVKEPIKIMVTEDAYRAMTADAQKKDVLQEALLDSQKKVKELEANQKYIYPVAGTLAGIILGLLIGNKLK